MQVRIGKIILDTFSSLEIEKNSIFSPLMQVL